MNFDGSTIATATSGSLIRDAAAGPIQTDTRKLEPGAWFLAIVGERFDGHAFLQTAAEKDCAGIIVSQAPDGWERGLVVVPDTTVALQDLGRHARGQLEVPVVGLTGSAGKTTTRALMALAMSPMGEVHQTVGNLNNHWGVPMTLVATPEGVSGLVVEMGTSSPGEIGLLAEIARPNVRLIVNVGPSHLLELGGLDGVAREKGALFATAEPGDVLCVNLDDDRIRELPWPDWTTTVTYGFHPGAEIRVDEAELVPERLATRTVFETPEGRIEVELPAPGLHIAHNAAGALAVARALGVDLHAAAAAMADYAPVGMRMRREDLPGGATALNDAYNANPASMEASLEVLAAMPGRRIAVLGTMLELGTQEDAWHAHIARRAGELGLELVVLVGEPFGMAAPCCEGAGDVWVFRDGEAAVPLLRDFLGEGDHVLFKGSRGARIELVLKALQGAR